MLLYFFFLIYTGSIIEAGRGTATEATIRLYQPAG